MIIRHTCLPIRCARNPSRRAVNVRCSCRLKQSASSWLDAVCIQIVFVPMWFSGKWISGYGHLGGKGEIGQGTMDDMVRSRRSRCKAGVKQFQQVDFQNAHYLKDININRNLDMTIFHIIYELHKL